MYKFIKGLPIKQKKYTANPHQSLTNQQRNSLDNKLYQKKKENVNVFVYLFVYLSQNLVTIIGL